MLDGRSLTCRSTNWAREIIVVIAPAPGEKLRLLDLDSFLRHPTHSAPHDDAQAHQCGAEEQKGGRLGNRARAYRITGVAGEAERRVDAVAVGVRVANWIAWEKRRGPAGLAIPPALSRIHSEPAAVRLLSCHPSAGDGSRRQAPPGWCRREPALSARVPLPHRVRWTRNPRSRRS